MYDNSSANRNLKVVRSQSSRPELILVGFQAGGDGFPESMGTFLSWLARRFRLCAIPAQSHNIPALLPSSERIYRWIDRLVFGRKRWAPRSCYVDRISVLDETALRGGMCLARDHSAAHSIGRDCIVFEFEGRPLDELSEAIRSKLAKRGSSLAVRVLHFQVGSRTRVLFNANLRLDHRSLQRSTVRVAEKALDLMEAVNSRIGMKEIREAPLADRSDVGVAPLALMARIPPILLRWCLFEEQWTLLVGDHDADAERVAGAFRRIEPPKGCFWADPFLSRSAGRRLLFFEELEFRTGRGHIAYLRLGDDGIPEGPARVVLKLDCHLSYPFVWEECGQIYLIPESAERKEVALYRFSENAGTCIREQALIEGERLADASIVRWNGRLWMFACRAEPDAAMDDVLYVYWADELRGPWNPHALNPVKIDTRSARPAGAPWVRDAQLYRPTQDCSDTYGSAVRCMRVTKLSPNEFEEEEVEEWGAKMRGWPEPWHTFNADDDLQVSDSLRPILRLTAR